MLISKDNRQRKTFFIYYPLRLSFAICVFNYPLRHKINDLESPSNEITENSWARGLRPTDQGQKSWDRSHSCFFLMYATET